MKQIMRLLLLAGGLALAACVTTPSAETEFWSRLTALCGEAYEGELVSDDPQDAAFASGELWMEVSECTPDRVLIDFMNEDEAVGHWVITPYGSDQLELRHIHKGDPLTGYGGYSSALSTASRMIFPADASTKALFDREGIPVSKANIWAIDVRPGVFAYELTRPDRFFRVEFDTRRAISEP